MIQMTCQAPIASQVVPELLLFTHPGYKLNAYTIDNASLTDIIASPDL
jgi:hypothetical protein